MKPIGRREAVRPGLTSSVVENLRREQPAANEPTFDSGVRTAGPRLDVDPGGTPPPQREVFGDENPWPTGLDGVPPLNARYATDSSRARTVAILGSSSNNATITDAIAIAAVVARTVVEKGGNIVSGAGVAGVMGAAYVAAREAAKTDGAGENLTLIKTPPWGDEDFTGARAIGHAPSEEARLEKFAQVAATVVAFPGGAGTALELMKLVNLYAYPAKGQVLPERVVVVGGESHWAGFKAMLEGLVKNGLTKPHVLDRFVWAESEAAVLAALPR